MKPLPDLAAGWSLLEYAERHEPELCRRFVAIRPQSDSDDNPRPTTLQSNCLHKGHDKAESYRDTDHLRDYGASDIQRELIASLLPPLQTGQLLVWGSKGKKDARPQAIPKNAWYDLTEWDFANSTVSNPSSEPGYLFNRVAIFPLLRQPEIAKKLDGMPIGLAFKKFVLSDPEITQNLKRSGAVEQPYRLMIGYQPAGSNPWLWPTRKRRNRLTPPLPEQAMAKLTGIDLNGNTERALAALVDRHSTFFGLLVDGEIIGSGTTPNGKAKRIPSGLWVKSNARMNIIDNTCGLVDCRDRMRASWQNVLLSLPKPAIERTRSATPTRPHIAGIQEMAEKLRPQIQAIAPSLENIGALSRSIEGVSNYARFIPPVFGPRDTIADEHSRPRISAATMSWINNTTKRTVVFEALDELGWVEELPKGKLLKQIYLAISEKIEELKGPIVDDKTKRVVLKKLGLEKR